jgi:hypothetical protein
MYLPTYIYVCLCLPVSIYLSVYLDISLCTCIYLNIHPSINQSTVYLSVSLSVSIPTAVCLYNQIKHSRSYFSVMPCDKNFDHEFGSVLSVL